MEGTRKQTAGVRFKHNVHEIGTIACRLWIINIMYMKQEQKHVGCGL
jgi:hypothetical protein